MMTGLLCYFNGNRLLWVKTGLHWKCTSSLHDAHITSFRSKIINCSRASPSWQASCSILPAGETSTSCPNRLAAAECWVFSDVAEVGSAEWMRARRWSIWMRNSGLVVNSCLILGSFMILLASSSERECDVLGFRQSIMLTSRVVSLRQSIRADLAKQLVDAVSQRVTLCVEHVQECVYRIKLSVQLSQFYKLKIQVSWLPRIKMTKRKITFAQTFCNELIFLFSLFTRI